MRYQYLKWNFVLSFCLYGTLEILYLSWKCCRLPNPKNCAKTLTTAKYDISYTCKSVPGSLASAQRLPVKRLDVRGNLCRKVYHSPPPWVCHILPPWQQCDDATTATARRCLRGNSATMPPRQQQDNASMGAMRRRP